MAGRRELFCAFLLSAVIIARAADVENRSPTEAKSANNSTRQLEPQGNNYHPLRHHQRPKDLTKLHYFNGKLDEDSEGSTTTTARTILDDRRKYIPGYIPHHPEPEYPQRPEGSGPGIMGGGGMFGGGMMGGGVMGGGMMGAGHRRNPFKVQFGWTEIDFTWPSPQARRQAINSGAYQSHNIIPLDVDVYEHNGHRKVFVTMPRGDGVPVALATVSMEGKKKSPRLAPYPDWSWHGGNGTCDRISSVYRVQVDECGRLWVLDRGDDRTCTPQLLLFDLRNDALVSRYRFPREVFRNGSNFITVSVDIRNGRCGEAFAYIADVARPALIVFDARNERSWRVEHPSFRPIEEYATYRIAGREFYLADGVFGLALGPLHRGERILYYHPLASVFESWVPTSVLRQRENFENGQNLVPNQFKTSRSARASQSAAQVMDGEGTSFSGLLSETAITCWNSDLPFGGWNLPIVAVDEESLQFPSGMKYHNGQVWVMTSRYQNFATDTMDWNDVNYRILSARAEDLVRGTMCDTRSTSAINALGRK